MNEAGDRDAAAVFEGLRPRLTRVAYRMLGSVADAEDAVQEAFIRWMGTDRSEVRVPEAFLRRTVTRLALDQLKSARKQREVYVGPWLPEPVAALHAPADRYEKRAGARLGRDDAAQQGGLSGRRRSHAGESNPEFV
jgi:DNA-directed RNA polymerase specialized sigma24 family protein